MSSIRRRILRNRKKRIEHRLRELHWENQPKPMFTASNIHYEMAERIEAIGAGGIGVVHKLARELGLIHEIDQRVHVLRRHLPYHESDHVLNIAYNFLAGGICLEDLELLRNDEAYLNALGAQRRLDSGWRTLVQNPLYR